RRRLAGSFQNLAFDVVKPAVITAAQSAVFDMAELQGRTAMHAAQSQHSNPALIVAEHDHVFAEDSSPLRFVLNPPQNPDRLPIAPQLSARRRAPPHTS